jgi:hypothetical protein
MTLRKKDKMGAMRKGLVFLIITSAVLAAGCGSPAAERFRCGGGDAPLIISILRFGGVGVGGLEYFPFNKPSWVRRVSVDSKRARLEITQKWAGRDEDGAPTSGEYLLTYELDRDAEILRIARPEMSALPANLADIEWEEERECEEMGELAFRVLELRAVLSLFQP